MDNKLRKRLVSAIDEYITFSHYFTSGSGAWRNYWRELRVLDYDLLKHVDPAVLSEDNLPNCTTLIKDGWFNLSGVTGTAMWEPEVIEEMNKSAKDEDEVRFFLSKAMLAGEHARQQAYMLDPNLYEMRPQAIIVQQLYGVDKYGTCGIGCEFRLGMRGKKIYVYSKEFLPEMSKDRFTLELVEDIANKMLAQSMIIFNKEEQEWHVSVSCENAPSLVLPTDPTGIYELFKYRDLPVGACRRATLLHWVDEHWRQMRDNPEMEVKVRKYFRGTPEFTHGDLRVRIMPSMRLNAEINAAKTGPVERRKRQRQLEKALARRKK